MENIEIYKRLIKSLENEYFFYSHNLEGEYLYMSPSVEKVLGYTVDEACLGLVKHMTDSELNKNSLETLKRSASGEKQKNFLLELYTKSKEVKIIKITESPNFNDKGELVSVDGVALDITKHFNFERIIQKQNKELKKQDDKLRESLKKLIAKNKRIDNLQKELDYRFHLLSNIINEIPEKIFLKDSDGKFLLANTRVAANYGLSPEELVGKSDFDFYPEEEARIKHEREMEVLRSGVASSYEEGDFDKEDGLIVNTKTKPFRIDDETVGLLGIQIDITQIKKNEIELRELNAKLTSSTEELNQTLKNLKETQSQLVHSEKMRALGNLIAGIAHEINTPIGAINASVSNISASLDNSINNLYTLFTQLSKKELVIFLKIMDLIERDRPALTSKEKRQFKKSIQHKLEAAGCEHVESVADLFIYLDLYESADKVIDMFDVEDPEFILKAIKDIYSVRKNSENIKMAVDKASKVVFALKTFAHKDQGDKLEQANLIENIETVLVLYHNQLKQSIEIIRDFDDVPLISCYPDELIQVWTNLISNAIHAMNQAGTLTLSVRNLGTHVKVSVKDTGDGIPEEIKEKIFEPFFTTKKSGEGTGIGLDIVRKILVKHNAKVDLESQTGVGTTFHVTLPVNHE